MKTTEKLRTWRKVVPCSQREPASHYIYNWSIIATQHHPLTSSAPHTSPAGGGLLVCIPVPPAHRSLLLWQLQPQANDLPWSFSVCEHVCVYMYVNNRKRRISLTMKEQQLHMDIKWKRSLVKEGRGMKMGVLVKRRREKNLNGEELLRRKVKNFGE